FLAAKYIARAGLGYLQPRKIHGGMVGTVRRHLKMRRVLSWPQHRTGSTQHQARIGSVIQPAGPGKGSGRSPDSMAESPAAGALAKRQISSHRLSQRTDRHHRRTLPGGIGKIKRAGPFQSQIILPITVIGPYYAGIF